MKLTQKAIKSYKDIGAIDITHYSFDEMNELIHNDNPEIIHWSCGVYGRNGVIAKGRNTGNTYVICSRTLANEML